MVTWIGGTLALAIHARQIAEHGGSAELRDGGLLESALARPQQLQAYGDPPPDLSDLAAALAYGLACNHPFADGNKRTAAVCCEAFVELNGATIEADDLELFPEYLALAEGKLAERDFAAWLRAKLRMPGQSGMHEPGPAYPGRGRPRTKLAPKMSRRGS